MIEPNKAAGTNGILPEMVKCSGPNFKQALLDLVHDVWKEGRVVKEWADAIIVPISKKGLSNAVTIGEE